MERQSGFADVNGARLYYEVAGNGHPLVMLHGHLIDSGQWDEQFDLFANHYRVVRYDARGFGRSTMPDQPFAYYQDLHGLMRFLGMQRAHLMGCSGGGATVIDFALGYPAMASALVLVGSGLGGYQFTGDPPPILLEMRAAGERGDVDRAVELSLQLWTDGANRRPDQVNPAARERTRAMTKALFSRDKVDAEEQSVEPPAAARLGEIETPTLAVVGDQDMSPILAIADMLVAQMPNARKLIIHDAGHHPNIEHPDEFNRAVLAFLAEVQ